MPASVSSKVRPRRRSARPAPEEMVKVVADVGPEMQEFAGFASERFWAFRTQDGHFRLDNQPWFATGLAFADVVAGELLGTATAQGGEVSVYGITRVVRPSGWRSLVACYAPPFSLDRSSAAKERLEALGAEIERARRHYWAVGVPPAVELEPVLEVLRREEHRGRFDWRVLAGV